MTPEAPPWFPEDVKHTAQVIQAALGYDASGDREDQLRITGLEPLIIAIAAKAVIGVASSLISRLLYDKWKTARNRDDLDQIAAQLSRTAKEGPGSPVDVQTAREDIINALTLEGLTRSQAEKVCGDIFERVKGHLKSTT